MPVAIPCSPGNISRGTSSGSIFAINSPASGLPIWYQWSGNEGFELLVNDKPATALNACRVMIAQISGYKLEKRIALASDQDYVLQYRNAAGEVKLVAWTSPPPGESQDKTVTHAVDLPVDTAGSATITQIYGDSAPGTITAGKLSLMLSGIPAVRNVQVKARWAAVQTASWRARLRD